MAATMQCIEMKENKKSDDEREEGEIVDDYEFIISSDEEFNMRQRIQELEAKNEELEQIAKISSNYSNDYNYADKQQRNSKVCSKSHRSRRHAADNNNQRWHRRLALPTDVSSISSFDSSPTPAIKQRHRKRPKVRSRDRRKHRYHHENKRSDIQLKRLQGKNTKDNSQKQKLPPYDTISLDSDDSLLNEVLSPDSSNNYESTLNRDELRLALVRDFKLNCAASTAKTQSNDDYIQLVNDSPNTVEQRPNENDVINIILSDDSSDSLGEQELRLIALKSAYMKKHVKRKQRDAEIAYSPTDFTEILAENENGEINMDLEETNEIDKLPTNSVSPLLSPKQVPSPTPSEDECVGVQEQRAVDLKSVDMDLVTSEDSDMDTERSMCLETIPLPNQLHDNPELQSQQICYHFNSNFPAVAAMSSTLYMPEMQYERYAEETPPPPPPFHRIMPETVVDINENAVDHQFEQFREIPLVNEENPAKEQASNATAELMPAAEVEEEDDEEEAEALRALLLSKFQSPKTKSKEEANIPTSLQTDQKENTPTTDSNANLPHDGKENLPEDVVTNGKLLQNITNQKPTELILKDAVRRFQVNKCKDTEQEPEPIEPKAKLRVKSNKELFGWDPFTVSSMGDKDYRFHNFTQMDAYIEASECRIGSNQNDEGNVVSSEPIETYPIQLDTCKEGMPEITSKVDVKLPEELEQNAVIALQVGCADVEPENLAGSDPQESEKQTEKEVEMTEKAQSEDHTVNSANELPEELDAMEVVTTNSAVPLPIASPNEPAQAAAVSSAVATTKPLKNNSNNLTATSAIPKKPVNSQTQPAAFMPTTASSNLLPTNVGFQKIVKPNKVINKNPALKRKNPDQQVIQGAPTSNKKAKPATNSTLDKTKTTSNGRSTIPPRFLTQNDVKKMKVQKLIINLRCSETETSEDELTSCFERHTSSLKAYIDTVSPLSLHIDSASNTPLRATTPINESNGGQTESPSFEEKLNTYLRTLRTQVDKTATTQATEASIATNNAPAPSEKRAVETRPSTPKKMIETPEDSEHRKTPLAVRHLPASAQEEYRRLLHRMNMLEKQKQAKLNSTPKSKENVPVAKTSSKASVIATAPAPPKTNKDSTTASTTPSKASLIRKVLVKNAENVNTDPSSNLNQNTSVNTSVPSPSDSIKPVLDAAAVQLKKLDLLSCYEKSFQKLGAGLSNVLDHSLKLVEEAKSTKISKLRYELRIEQLRAELKSIEEKHKQADQKLTQIYPKVEEAHSKILNLKQKKNKLEVAAVKLGTNLHGKNYRPVTDKELHARNKLKAKRLAAEIKHTNSIKLDDIRKLIANEKTTKNTENATTMPVLEHSKDEEAQQHEPKEETMDEANSVGNTKKPLQVELIPDIVQPDENSASYYISPLTYKSQHSELDPFATVCPYALMGECRDNDCKYLHVNAPAAK